MKIWTGKRGCGKTTRLIHEANNATEQGFKIVVLVSRKDREDILREKGLNEKVEVVTFKQYQRDSIGSNKYKDVNIMIDQADAFLRDILNNNVASITVDIENIYYI